MNLQEFFRLVCDHNLTVNQEEGEVCVSGPGIKMVVVKEEVIRNANRREFEELLGEWMGDVGWV